MTFSEMLGVDPHDYAAVDLGIPDVDGYNMWPLIAGDVDESPRYELIMNKNTLMQGEYKLITGSSTKVCNLAIGHFSKCFNTNTSRIRRKYVIYF